MGPVLSGTIHHCPICGRTRKKESSYVKQETIPSRLVSALLLPCLRKAGAGVGVEVPVEPALVVPVEVLARAVLPAQAAAVRPLLPIRRPILQARPGAAAPILG